MARKDDMEALVSKKPPPQDSNGHRPRSRSSSASKALITRNLKLIYGETAAEPLPKRFTDLLDQLGEQEEKKS